MNIVLNTNQSYKLSELAQAVENSTDDLFYVVKQVDGNDVSYAITREQLIQGISGGDPTIQDGGANVGTRPNINFIEGTNVTFTITDDAPNDRVNITIDVSGGGAVDSVNGQTGVVVLDLDNIDDVPAYPNDGQDYVLVENTGVLTWEIPTGDFDLFVQDAAPAAPASSEDALWIDTDDNTGGSGGQVNTVVAGTGIAVDATDPVNPIVSSTVTPGGVVDSVTGTADEIDVAGTAADPVLSLAGAVTSSLSLADSSVQTVIGTANEIDVDATDPANLIAKIADTVLERLATSLKWASPMMGPRISGRYYDNGTIALQMTPQTMSANELDLTPFSTALDFNIDQLGIVISTAGSAGTFCKMVIYDVNDIGEPTTLLFESSNIDVSTTGYKFTSISYSFIGGKQYYLGVRASGDYTMQKIGMFGCLQLGLLSATTNRYASVIRQLVTFADPAPNPFVFNFSDLGEQQNTPSIRFRVA